jgi:hypothetical protein
MFTRALAELLPAGSVIHAVDRDAYALSRVPVSHGGVDISKHVGDFARGEPQLDALDGVLMANSLHYVQNQRAVLHTWRARMPLHARFLLVEYDAAAPSRWVPYPVSRARLPDLFPSGEHWSVTVLGTRPSVYQRAALYAALAQTPGGDVEAK